MKKSEYCTTTYVYMYRWSSKVLSTCVIVQKGSDYFFLLVGTVVWYEIIETEREWFLFGRKREKKR